MTHNLADLLYGWQSVFADSDVAYPPYDLYKSRTGDNEVPDKYVVEVALAGFPREAIELTLKRNVLTISADKQPSQDEGFDVVQRGIARRKFVRRFHVANNVEVTDASYKDGILRVLLHRYVPLEDQPKRIEIKCERKCASTSSAC